ncbi:MAG: L,D-transpeptidase [Coxiellaceae bacterium]|nr:L,D-transpeptidase [Coxiellaceae bacterium]|tara:strand:+ start:3222 stop:3788 length:567 start_codon:yes stop_codon:yes gene_type:complete
MKKIVYLTVFSLIWLLFAPGSYAAKVMYWHNDKPAFLLTKNPHSKKSYLKHFPPYWETDGNRLIVFNPKTLSFGIYNSNGRKIGAGKAVGGASYSNKLGRSAKTVRGTYTFYRKNGEHYKSGKYPRPRGGAPMHYAMHFHGGYALHGSPSLPDVNASHGCIRVEKQTAGWLSKYFVENNQTQVHIMEY